MKRNDLPPDYETREKRMVEIVGAMPGFLGFKQYTAADGETISFWRFASEEALETWRTHAEHLQAQEYGRKSVYDYYWGQICQVIRQYELERGDGRRQIPADEPWWPAFPEKSASVQVGVGS